MTRDININIKLNGLPTHVHPTDGKTILIPLPRVLWREIDGGCQCAHCKTDDGRPGVAYWDTLAVSPDTDNAHTIHAPEFHDGRPPRYHARNVACEVSA